MRRWARIPPPPVKRQPCDCEAKDEQIARLRERNHTLEDLCAEAKVALLAYVVGRGDDVPADLEDRLSAAVGEEPLAKLLQTEADARSYLVAAACVFVDADPGPDAGEAYFNLEEARRQYRAALVELARELHRG